MAVGASKLAAFRGARAVQTGEKGGRYVTLASGKRWYVPDNYGARQAASGAIPRAPVAKQSAPLAAVSRPRVGHEGPIPNPKPGPWIDHVAHLPKETYAPGQALTPERKQLHEDIIAHYLNNAQPVPKDRSPVAVVMMGGPASGKTSATRDLIPRKDGTDTPVNMVLLNSDAVKEHLPEYREAIGSRAKDAAKMVHEESSMLAKTIRQKAIAERKNLLYDGTGTNADDYLKMVKDLHAAGYHVNLVMTDLPHEEAKKRAALRAEHSGRLVPDEIIDKAYKTVPVNFQRVADAADEFRVYSSNVPQGTKPPLVWSREGGAEVTHDPKWHREFNAKVAALKSAAKGT